jgi:hypothetical protein
MSYQTIALVYGVTLTEKEYKRFKKKLKKIGKELALSNEDYDDGETMDDYEILNELNISIFNGYYHDVYKVGFVIEEDEVRTMQDFVFDFTIPTANTLKKVLTKNEEIIEKLGLDKDKFDLGVCTNNY